jgi:hypothetical protein
VGPRKKTTQTVIYYSPHLLRKRSHFSTGFSLVPGIGVAPFSIDREAVLLRA